MGSVWILAGAAVGGVLLLPLVQLGLGVKPPKIASGITPERLGLEHETVHLLTEDGLELDAWWIPAAEPSSSTVVASHGYPAEKGDVLGTVAFLHDRHNLLVFDHRSFGDSEGTITTVGLRETQDVQAAIDHALEREATETVAAWGFSLSASTILLARDERLAAIVADSPFASLEEMIERSYGPMGPLASAMGWLTGLYARLLLGAWPSEADVEAAVESSSTPILFIHGEADAQIPVEHARRLAARAGPEAELWTVPGAGHGATHALAADEYERRVRGFLGRHTEPT